MLRAALPGQGSWPRSFCSRTAPLELCPGFSRPPAHQHPLGEVGRREREGARERAVSGRERRSKRRRKRGLSRREGGNSPPGQGCVASSALLPPKALVLPAGCPVLHALQVCCQNFLCRKSFSCSVCILAVPA